MFGFLVGFEDGACAFALGATREKVHFSPARDFILLANLCAAVALGRMILTNFLFPLNSSWLIVCSIQQSLMSNFFALRMDWISVADINGMFRIYRISGRSETWSTGLFGLLFDFRW